MRVLKGFITIDSRIDNSGPGVAPIGQISLMARTYSRRKTVHFSDDVDGIRYILFSARDSANTILAISDDPAITEALVLGGWVEDYVRNNITIPDPSEIIEAIQEAFPEFSDIVVGEQINVEGDWYPTRIGYKNIDGDYRQTLWFADSYFTIEYDEYEIEVIHPVEELDKMLEPYNIFINELKKYTYDVQVDRLSLISEQNPYTLSRSQTFTWYDQTNSSLTTEVSWTVAIYGAAGDNLERIQNAIVTKVREETSGTDEQWQTAVPDLFSPTEFVIVPFWDNIAIPDSDIQSGIYSPVSTHANQRRVADVILSGYSPSHVDNYLEYTTMVYKSLGVISLGATTNRGDQYKITDVFPDYILASTTSTDFARMTVPTQQWVLLMQEMLYVADTYVVEEFLPPHMVVTERDGVRYILSQLNGSQYLVGERTSVADKLDKEP